MESDQLLIWSIWSLSVSIVGMCFDSLYYDYVGLVVCEYFTFQLTKNHIYEPSDFTKIYDMFYVWMTY